METAIEEAHKRHLKNQWFRAGSGVVICREDGRVLAFRRKGIKKAWQFPQGGMDPGESPLETAYRELDEESGIQPEHLELLTEKSLLLAYEVDEAYRKRFPQTRGQVHYWYLFRMKAPLDVIDLKEGTKHQEFDKFKWMSMKKLTKVVIDFRKPVYRRLRKFIKAHNQIQENS